MTTTTLSTIETHNLYLSGDEADSYIKYREQIKVLTDSGIFELSSGKIELNIHNGQIQNIFAKEMIYKRIAG